MPGRWFSIVFIITLLFTMDTNYIIDVIKSSKTLNNYKQYHKK